MGIVPQNSIRGGDSSGDQYLLKWHELRLNQRRNF